MVVAGGANLKSTTKCLTTSDKDATICPVEERNAFEFGQVSGHACLAGGTENVNTITTGYTLEAKGGMRTRAVEAYLGIPVELN